MKDYKIIIIGTIISFVTVQILVLNSQLNEVKTRQQITQELYKQNLLNEYKYPFTNSIAIGIGSKPYKDNELVITFADGTELRTTLKPIKWK